MRTISILTVALLSAACSASPMLSTTTDGGFQAIAQSPTSIAVYWRHHGAQGSLYMNGNLVGVYQPNPNGSFTCAVVSGLAPNTCYTFSQAQSVPAVSEKTWAALPSEAEFDLLVIGGTASGVSAAVNAARLGLRVALVEETNRVGGMSSNGLGSADIRNPSRSNGFFQEFRERLIQFYGEGSGLHFEPRAANAIFKIMLYEQPNISLFLKSTAVRPIVSGNRVLGAEVKDLQTGRCGRICAPVTIDATDTADFSAAAGAPFSVGREPRSAREPHAGAIYFDDKTQEILPGTTGQGDLKTQSYAYLMIWKDYGDADAPLVAKPRFHDPETYRNSPDWPDTWNASSGKLPNDKYEINQHPFGIDWPGINYDYPTANASRRREIDAMNRDRALGYLYFMQNERGHKNLGLADDEFLDNGNFPVSLYVREARRLHGEYTLVEDEVTNARDFHRVNSIAIGDYPMDSHAMEDLKDPTRVDKGEGEEWLAHFTPWHQVPYGVILPRCVEGLLVTTAVSATHVAYGTLRMEAVRMSLGQAAAAATYWSLLFGIPLRSVNPAWIQDRVLSQGSYINWNSDVTASTRHFVAINFLGARGIFPDEAFRPSDSLSRQEAAAALEQMQRLESQPAPPQTIPAQPRSEITASSGDIITRGEFAVMLVDAKKRLDPAWNCAPTSPCYEDVPASSPYFTAVETLLAHHITAMLFADPEPGKFKPDAPIARADAAEAIYLAHRPFAVNFWRP